MLGPRSGATGRATTWMLAALLAAQSGWLLYPRVRAWALGHEETQVVRGERLATALGCFTCHGPLGTGGVANPTRSAADGKNFRTLGAEGEVPPFTEQTQMMYVKTTDDLREYILDGAPKRRRDDPEYRQKMEAAALQMPAYRDRVSAAELEDLVVFLRANSGQIIPEEKDANRGYELALELDCFACHGAMGAGGLPNPGSFKGYIPGFWGADYDELVENREELVQWLADGKIARIAEHPIGRIYFEGQSVKMPAYGQFVQPADIQALVAYVEWLRSETWRSQLR
jgi:mono/diheme cytochrome c family protein